MTQCFRVHIVMKSLFLVSLILINILQVITQWNSNPSIHLVGILKQTDGFEYVCAGTLLTNNFVITAAHCVRGHIFLEDGRYLVIYGTNFSSDFGKYVNNGMPVTHIDVHPNYNHTYNGCNKYDIALLKLQYPVFNYLHFSIAMDKSFVNAEEAVMIFWKRSNGGEYALEFVSLQIFNRTICEIIDNGVKKPFIQGNICAAPNDHEISLESGDCGSPLITGRGALSGVLHCALGNRKIGYKVNKVHPAVFLRISDFYNWILRVVEARGGTEYNLFKLNFTEPYDKSTGDNKEIEIMCLLVSILFISFYRSFLSILIH